MSSRVQNVSSWMYRGLWGMLTRWFRVPDKPPTLPVAAGESADSFQPAPGFLSYMMVPFWIGLLLFDGLVFIAWVVLMFAEPAIGLITSPFFFALAVVPDIIAYLAIHLRYDTTWYVMTGRSLRIRRGIWVIRETTITFENVQNVTVNQGPLQRFFGIADVRVDTAGGGGAVQGPHGTQAANPHQGLIEGIANARDIRDRILTRLRASGTTGLGDEGEPVREAGRAAGWSTEHVAVLREIRDALAAG